MSNKGYRTYYENPRNNVQKASSTYYPRGRNFNNSSNLNSNKATETKFEPKKNKNFKKMRKNKNSEKITDMKLNLEAEEHLPNREKLKNQEKEKEGKKEREKIQQEKEEKIKNEYKYSYDYLIQFETWEISNGTERIPEEALKHINEMIGHLEEIEIFYPKDKIKNNYSNCNTSKSSSSSNISFSMEQWARKDYSKEIQEAEDNKKKFEESDQKDVIKKELRAILNIMTKDNYNETKSKILEIIKENVEYQEQFLEIFILKAVMEKSYAELYAKLCKYLNKALPQKTEKNEKSSIFRDKLIKKCREIFKTKNFDIYIKEKEISEKEIALKKFIIGNVNFMTELIKIKMLSKKIIPDCIDYLFDRYYEIDKEKELKLIFAQSIILFTDKFGTLIHSEKKSLKSEENQKFKESIEKIFIKLEKIKNDKDLPGHIKYLIINLIEKKNNNYRESQFEKSLKAKSKKELEEELENKEIEKEIEGFEEKDKEQIEINEKIKKDLNEYKDFIEEEGNSEKYLWNITTELYDVKLKKFDDILEGYILSTADFIEKNNNNTIYAKDYIKELIEYYETKMNEEEKNDLQKRIINLFDIVNDLAFETPKIYDVYSYVIFILIDNNIMEIENLVNFYKEGMNQNDICILNKVFKNICEYDESELFKKKLKKVEFISKNKEVFEWIFV